MVIDLVFCVLIVLASIKGFQRGLIVGIFSFIAIVVGLAAAIKLSAIVASYIGNTVKVSDKWLPVISFLVVFIGVVLLVRLGANLLQKAVEMSLMGWVNRLGGILLYVAIYALVFSVLIFYAEKLQLLQPTALEKSLVYPYIKPWGPIVIDGFGAIIPWFRDMFAELTHFFDGVGEEIKK